MECFRCKAQNGNHRSFCWRCRREVAFACSRCKSPNGVGAAHCGECGKNFLDAVHPVLGDHIRPDRPAPPGGVRSAAG